MRVLGKLFRGVFLSRLLALYDASKLAFFGSLAPLAYLSRYTHRVAISNRRLLASDGSGVTFRYKDYRRDDGQRQRVMTLAADEFIRRLIAQGEPRLRPRTSRSRSAT